MKTISIQHFYEVNSFSNLLDSISNVDCVSGYHFRILNNEFVNGTMKTLNINDITICYQEWNIKSPFKLAIAHQQELIKLQFEIEGDSKFRSADQQKIDIPSGHYQFIYIPNAKGVLHYSTSRKVLDIHIPLDHILAFLSSQGLSEKEIRDHCSLRHFSFFHNARQITPQQHILIQELLNHQYQDEFAKEFIRIKTLELIFSAFKDNNVVSKESRWSLEDRNILAHIKNYLDCNFQQELRLKNIARQFGINENKLKNAFKELFHDTVINYVRKQRVQHAHHLLLHSDMDIKEIAYISGFKYAHHFSQVYLQHYQQLPSATRQSFNR